MKYKSHSAAGTFRMFQWLLISLTLYVLAVVLAKAELLPQVQTMSWKLGHETIAAFMGYWIDRSMFRDRMGADTPPLLQIRRAVIIAATMLAVAMGM